MSFEENIKTVKNTMRDAQLIIVTKHQSIDNIKKIYSLGERAFGENKVQELIIKKALLPKDIKWHMIGHLQTNKIKLIAPFIYMIQSVDSLKLLKLINQHAELNKRVIKCLIQIKISQETTKYGFNLEEANEMFQSGVFQQYKYVQIKGVMGMGSLTNNTNQLKKEFKLLKTLSDKINIPNSIISMGMSNDYQLACNYGSNMIRVGSVIFK